jgi:hypothetical protein
MAEEAGSIVGASRITPTSRAAAVREWRRDTLREPARPG